MAIRDEDPTENLPAPAYDAEPLVQVAAIHLNGPKDLDQMATEQEAKEVDVSVANDLLRASYAALTQAASVSTLCRAIDQTIKVLECRRKVLMLPYGSDNTRARSTYLLPLD